MWNQINEINQMHVTITNIISAIITISITTTNISCLRDLSNKSYLGQILRDQINKTVTHGSDNITYCT